MSCLKRPPAEHPPHEKTTSDGEKCRDCLYGAIRTICCCGAFTKLAKCTYCVFECLCCLRKISKAYNNSEVLPTPPCNCLWNWAQLGTTFGAVMLLLWLLFRPDRFQPRVDSAVLAALDIANGNDTTANLRYDLAMDISFVNSHSHLSVWYLDVGATAFYGNSKLGPANDALPSFNQGPNNTTVLHPAFRGVATVDSEVAATLQSERAAGTAVLLKVSVDLTLMSKVWFKKQVYFYKYDCWLSFTPSRNAAAPAVFHGAGTLCLGV